VLSDSRIVSSSSSSSLVAGLDRILCKLSQSVDIGSFPLKMRRED
jgi:hypothetical protein